MPRTEGAVLPHRLSPASGDRLGPSVLEMKHRRTSSCPGDVLKPHGATEFFHLLFNSENSDVASPLPARHEKEP